MTLRMIGTLVLPAHRAPGGFDHACVHRRGDRLYVAHTANDSLEVIDLERRVHAATLPGLPGVAGVAVCEQRGLLAATCRREGHVALAAVAAPTSVRRIPVGERPNGLAVASGRGIALVACIGDPTPPSMAIIDLDRGAVLASAPLPGRPRWAVYDENAGCFYVNVAAPPQIVVVRDGPPFDVVRSMAIPAPGPHGLDQDPRRGLLHCACDASTVVTVQPDSCRVVSQTAIAGTPDVIFFNARRDRLYVAIGDPGVLQVIDTGAGRVVETVATEKGAHTIGFDDAREHVFCFLPGSHAATVLAES